MNGWVESNNRPMVVVVLVGGRRIIRLQVLHTLDPLRVVEIALDWKRKSWSGVGGSGGGGKAGIDNNLIKRYNRVFWNEATNASAERAQQQQVMKRKNKTAEWVLGGRLFVVWGIRSPPPPTVTHSVCYS